MCHNGHLGLAGLEINRVGVGLRGNGGGIQGDGTEQKGSAFAAHFDAAGKRERLAATGLLRQAENRVNMGRT